jgi:type IV secretion system protein VirB9
MKGSVLRNVCVVGLALAGVSWAHGQVTEQRVKTVEYTENTVVTLDGCMNFQTTVIFGLGEQIENVGLGDANQWQVMPNRRADLVFVKPLAARALSNMTVVTARHIYNFELRTATEAACRRGRVVYTMRFHYPDVPASGPVAKADSEAVLPLPEKRNSAYTYSGDKDLVPFRVFDDGKSTYFLWAKGVATPAIYVIGLDKKESLVNYANRGEYVEVDLVGKTFMLRRGELSAKLFNEAYADPKLDAQSPQPAKDAPHSFWDF